MNHLYQRNPVHHVLLARQGLARQGLGDNRNGNNGVGPSDLGVVTAPSTSQAAPGMFTASLLPS
jgi:hypothetical protein